MVSWFQRGIANSDGEHAMGEWHCGCRGTPSRIWCSLVAALAILICCPILESQVVRDLTGSIRWPGEGLLGEPILEVGKAFASGRGRNGATLSFALDYKANLGWFASSAAPFDVIARYHYPDSKQAEMLSDCFPKDSPQPTVFGVGWRRVVVIVNGNNTVQKLALSQLGMLLKDGGKRTDWQALSGPVSASHCYSEKNGSWSCDLVRRRCMAFTEQRAGYLLSGWREFRDDMQKCADAEEVIKKVKADGGGIGFFQYTSQPLLGVKVLAIASETGSTFVAPKLDSVIQEDYPLAEPLVFYLHPKAPPLASEFCEFAVGPEGSAVAEKLGFVTPCMQKQAEGKARLAEMKSGKGERIGSVGVLGGQKVAGALATEYVRAKAVVQVGFNAVDSDTAAMGGFLGGEGKQALLLLNDRPSVQAMAALGERWEQVKPTEYLLAARGAAIIVNPANQLGALTQDQVRGIFKGEIADWGILGGTGLAASGKKAPITAYGLPAGDPVSAILQQEGVLVQSHQVTATKDSAEVLAAVAADSQGIGVVDLAALPVGDKSVRVLAIQIGSGNKAELVPPTPDNLKNAMYPYAQRVYLYVHPQASDAAKDFAKFVATCGAAEATLSADTLKTTMDAYRKNGLISLAEAAIDRAAKEAFDAAKAEPAKAETKK